MCSSFGVGFSVAAHAAQATVSCVPAASVRGSAGGEGSNMQGESWR